MPVKESIYIDAPVGAVFDFWKDPQSLQVLMPGNGTFTELKRTQEGVGTYYSWTMKLFGIPVKGFDVFTEFIPNQRITDRSSFALAGTWTYTVEPEGSGTRCTIERQPESVWALRLFDPLFDRYRAGSTKKMLGRLKAELEKPEASAATPGVPAQRSRAGTRRRGAGSKAHQPAR